MEPMENSKVSESTFRNQDLDQIESHPHLKVLLRLNDKIRKLLESEYHDEEEYDEWLDSPDFWS